MNCKVCNTPLQKKYSVCLYCGYSNKVVLTPSADDSADYKASLLSRIRNISMEKGRYQYQEAEKEVKELERISLFPSGLSGEKYSKDIIQSKDWIAHFEGEAKLSISYEFNGKKRHKSIQIKPNSSEGVWYLGLHLNPEFRLEIYQCVYPVKNKKSRDQVTSTGTGIDTSARKDIRLAVMELNLNE